jgi:radical SAM protein with 4Fe4S-binding SPASM domain
MTLNQHEFLEMQDIARRYGARFRIDGEIFPRFNGEKSPVQLRIPCEEVVEKEFSDKQRFLGYKAFYKRFEEIPAAETLYSCGAGVTHFHVDPSGMLQPCLMVRSLRYDLSQGSFLKGWHEVMLQIRNKRAESSYGCNRCEKRILCSVCPAFFELESESEILRSDYLCSIGQLRYEALQREMMNER